MNSLNPLTTSTETFLSQMQNITELHRDDLKEIVSFLRIHFLAKRWTKALPLMSARYL